MRFGILPLPVKLLITLLKSKRFKDLVKNLLTRTVKEEISEDNVDKFVFWRLFKEIVFSSYLENTADKKLIM